MRTLFLAAGLLLLASAASAQRRCVKGIPCGGSCISASKTCRIGTGSATSESPARPTSSGSPARIPDYSSMSPRQLDSVIAAQQGYTIGGRSQAVPQASQTVAAPAWMPAPGSFDQELRSLLTVVEARGTRLNITPGGSAKLGKVGLDYFSVIFAKGAFETIPFRAVRTFGTIPGREDVQITLLGERAP